VLERDERSPEWLAAREPARPVERVHDPARLGGAGVRAGLLSEHRVGGKCCADHVEDGGLGFAVGHRHR
jgi:hypothetical protein